MTPLVFEYDTVYELTTDVVNPNADRRVKYNWQCSAVISKGTRFLAEVEHLSIPGTNKTVSHATIRPMSGRDRRLLGERDELFVAMLPFLRKVEISPDERVAQILKGWNAEDILVRLIRSGKLDYDAVIAIVDQIEAEPE